MSIRWKIAIVCILVTLVPVVFLNHYAVRVFDGFTRKMLEEKMIDYARVIGEEHRLVAAGAESGESFVLRLRQYGKEFGARLQIADASGIIVFDSAEPPDTGADYSDRSEMKKALLGRYGARSALTPDRKRMYYYVALPVAGEGGQVLAVAYVTTHTEDITKAIIRMAHDYRITLLVSLLAAAGAAVLLAITMTRRLRALTRAVISFARGDSPMTLEQSGRDEIGDLGRAFGQMAEEIKKINDQNRNLISVTTHELKAPLTAIRSSVQLLQEGGAAEDPQTRRKFLGNIGISTERLLSLVEDLGILSKLNSEELRGKKEKVQYGAFVKDAVARLYPSPDVKIAVDIPEQDAAVSIIPQRIEQVLANLLSNSLRHTPPDGSITVTVRAGEKEVITSVKDTGEGISPSDLPKVFQQFYTTVPKNSLKDYGSGLGLSIAQTIVRNHGGRIWAESEQGKGSTFTFTLPV